MYRLNRERSELQRIKNQFEEQNWTGILACVRLVSLNETSAGPEFYREQHP
jgi:hypothetical protein